MPDTLDRSDHFQSYLCGFKFFTIRFEHPAQYFNSHFLVKRTIGKVEMGTHNLE